MSWLLMATVALHAAVSPAANWALVTASQSEEESEPRENPAEEEVSEVFGAAPPRGPGFSRGQSTYLRVNHSAAKVSSASGGWSRIQQPAELAARNGVGAPLRC